MLTDEERQMANGALRYLYLGIIVEPISEIGIQNIWAAIRLLETLTGQPRLKVTGPGTDAMQDAVGGVTC